MEKKEEEFNKHPAVKAIHFVLGLVIFLGCVWYFQDYIPGWIGALNSIVSFSSTPTKSYNQLVTDASQQEWDKVYDRIDKKSQAKIDMSFQMLAGMATAFNRDDPSLEGLDQLEGKELFVRFCQSTLRNPMKEKMAGEVVQEQIQGDWATLVIRYPDGTTTNVSMLKEDGIWKLSVDEKDTGKAEQSHQQQRSAAQAPASPGVPATPPVTQNTVEIVDTDLRVTDSNEFMVEYGWKVTLRSLSSATTRYQAHLKLLDADGFVVDEEFEFGMVLGSMETKTFTFSGMTTPEKWEKITNFNVGISR